MNKKIAAKLKFKRFDANCEIRAGSVLKLKDDRIVLVGDVNELLGVCDDCTEFKRDAIQEIAHIEDLKLR